METLKILLDIYFTLIVTFFVSSFILRSRKVFIYSFFIFAFLALFLGARELDLKITGHFAKYYIRYCPFLYIVVVAPEFKNFLDRIKRIEKTVSKNVISSEGTKMAIIEAVDYLAERRIGAIITLENHNSLDQYAERAIQMNSDISKELLINIFSPLTPLHDGAVIIKGDKIRCAGAYYVLTQTDAFDKTMGSRHRAALGISEVTDSLTIVCSEETGNISITVEGIMLKVNDKEKLNEYIDMFMK